MKTLSHRQAMAVMICAALMWSIAGVVTRLLDSARGFEVTFWRSLANALALVLLLGMLRGPAVVIGVLRGGGRALWLSAACWCVMYTAFMMALTLTTVANVLVTMALGPMFTALIAWLVLKHRLPMRTWAAIVLAGIGIAWMYGHQFAAGQSRQLLGTVVALCVPLAAAVNWNLLQHLARGRPKPNQQDEMLVAVMLGAWMSAALTLPLAWPLAASTHDISWLALLGLVQLAIPCLMAVTAARTLAAPEASLLSLLEVVFGVAWAWLGAGEAPSLPVLGGGALVLLALAGNEALALRGRAVLRN